MFLDALVARNRPLVEAAVRLHQDGAIPANSHVLDLDTMRENAAAIAAEARRLGLTVLAMTKQFGRNPPALDALAAGGIGSFVAVDMPCARPIARAGHKVGHLGHLTQVPRHEAADAAWAAGYVQDLLARIVAPGDRFYDGHEGGFPVDELEALADRLDARRGGRFAGVTTFPALLFDEQAGEVLPTPNLRTVEAAARRLESTGRHSLQVNAPGTTSSVVLARLAEAGATQVEPGHGLTGTTPLHAVRELPERPAMLYVTEVSHLHQGTPFVFGGGLYVDPVFKEYPVRALVGADPDAAIRQPVRARIPHPGMIDYYGKLEPEPGQTVRVGDTAVYGFRAQAFFRRPFIVPLAGLSSGRPEVRGVWLADGRPAEFLA